LSYDDTVDPVPKRETLLLYFATRKGRLCQQSITRFAYVERDQPEPSFLGRKTLYETIRYIFEKIYRIGGPSSPFN
jgi:hypothetical protein